MLGNAAYPRNYPLTNAYLTARFRGKRGGYRSADFRPSSFAFVHLQRLAPEADNGGGEVVRALLGQKVAAALGRTALYRAALYTVADRRDRCAQGVADALVPTARQDRHWQPLRGAHLGLGESFRAEIDAVPGEAGSHRARQGIGTGILLERGGLDREGSGALGRVYPGEIGALASLHQDFGQVVQPIEGELPALEVRGFARDARSGVTDSGREHVSTLVSNPASPSVIYQHLP